MRRRDFIAGIGAASIWPAAADAQEPDRSYRIALLGPLSPPKDVFWDELRRNGFVEGRNLLVDLRGIGVEATRFEAVAAELVKTGPDAIVTVGPAAGHAAQHATKSISIVVYADDPVESGLVASMLRPGGNTTGVGIFAAQLDAKRLEILHELVPTARRIGVLADPSQEVGLGRVEALGRDLNLELVVHKVRGTSDILAGIDALATAQTAAIIVLASAVFYVGRTQIIDRTRALGLPTIYWWGELAREGGLVGFGPSLEEAERLLAQQLLRVLNGAAPGEVPIIQPTKFELVVNLKTAKALGFTVPPAILGRADEVIE